MLLLKTFNGEFIFGFWPVYMLGNLECGGSGSG